MRQEPQEQSSSAASADLKLVLVAAGGHAAEVLSYVEDMKRASIPVDLLGVVDDGKPVGPWESSVVLGGMDYISRLAEVGAERLGRVHFMVCVGSNQIRKKLADRFIALPNATPWTLIHPSAQVGRGVRIGSGTLLAPNVIVTTRTSIGAHSILNAKASVHHDCTVGDFVNINPGATICGSVQIGDGAFIGAGATIINGRSVGANTVIGAGAVVTKDIPDNVTAVGVPARIVKSHRAL